MPFVPHTENDIADMLETIGAKSIDDLFDEIPKELLSKELQHVPEGRSEMDVLRLMGECAEQDAGKKCFIGAGAYEHHIPSAVWDIAARGEFMTAYTPYQAEASQGTLQLIYEYQSMMAHLCDMDVSNASMYDGASALAEAILMAVRANRKSKSRKILIPTTLHPEYKKTSHAIVRNQNIELVNVAMDAGKGISAVESLAQYDDEDIAAIVIAQPNFFGNLEDVDAITNWANAKGVFVIAVCNPTAMSVITPPGQWGENDGADIVIGEGQPLGVPIASGGPYFGFMCCKQKHVRQMPGRIIGRTVDLEGKEGFALTLQAREQHIRRSKATSNICTNQGWAVTAATIYMSLLGAKGLQNVASTCHENLNLLKAGLEKIAGVELTFSGPQFHELVFSTPYNADDVLEAMLENDILGGYAIAKDFAQSQVAEQLQNAVLVCTTETKNQSDIENYLSALTDALVKLAAAGGAK